MDLTSPHSGLALGRDALLSGDAATAVDTFARLVAEAPRDVEARYWLASALLTAGDAQRAFAAMDDARILHALPMAAARGADLGRCRSDPAYGHLIADQFYGQNMVALSGVVRAMALQAGDLNVNALLAYGLALQHQGRAEEASQIFRAASETFPSPQVDAFVIYPQMMCDDGDARHAAAARDWAHRYAPALSDGPLTNPDLAGRKLKIGYVAPGFASTQLKQFLAPLLETHDPERVSVTLYPAKAETEQGWPAWIDVHPTGDLDDASAAALIRRDGIDILADCWGHTAGSRLPIFARRPAPVQVAWINFIQTTGLEQMDYVLHGSSDAPSPTEGLFTEAVWPIGPVFNAFRPGSGRLPAAPTPALTTGQVTFGSFNHPAKLSDWVVDAWGAVLRGAPSSRLLLKYRYFDDPVLQRVTQARFAARGVAPERIVFEGHSSGKAYFAAYRHVDLMFDSWPAPGSTTTLDALSNGVPVLAKPTPTVGGDCVRAILQASSLPELIAESPEDFVARALDLTSDLKRLDALRARVRPGFDNGPCCDEAGFTHRVEAAFSEMFEIWRAKRRAANG